MQRSPPATRAQFGPAAGWFGLALGDNRHTTSLPDACVGVTIWVHKVAHGKLISFEGIDGAGKSTQLDHAARCLAARGLRTRVTREPGGTPLAEQLRALLLAEPMDAITETLLLFAARRDHVERVIRPALAAGEWVLCDRFFDATLAYQGAGRGVAEDWLRGLQAQIAGELEPDLTLLFDVPEALAAARLRHSGAAADRFEREPETFFGRVRSMYLAHARAAQTRVCVIDARAPAEQVTSQVEAALTRLTERSAAGRILSGGPGEGR